MTRLQDFLNSPLTKLAVMGGAPRAGDLFGVELECEGKRVDYRGDDAILRMWAPHADGSLRNNHGSSCEWVFNGPVSYKASVERVNALFDYFEKQKAQLICSNRTSLHVHYNMGDKNAYQLVNLFILFTILEGVLDNYCGEDRVGNLFCLSSRHAEQQLNRMMDACFTHYSFNRLREDQRYCSLNVAALNKFGTVEFRGMRGLDNREDVLRWLSILNDFCEFACYKMKNPVDIVRLISEETPTGFMRKVFSKENVDELLKSVSEYDLNASVYEGLRLVQMLCYKIGTEFEQVRLRGRDFWASFSDDKEPQLDVDPAAFAAGGIPVRPPRAGRQRAHPFGGDPFLARPRNDNAEQPDLEANQIDFAEIERRILKRLAQGIISARQANKELQAMRRARDAVPPLAPHPLEQDHPGQLAEFAARMRDNNRIVRAQPENEWVEVPFQRVDDEGDVPV